MSPLEMSLFYVVTHNFTLWPDGYKCSENATRLGTGRPHYATYCFVSGGTFLFFYVLCFIAICKVKTFTPAYQLMLIISIYDMYSLIIGSIVHGYFAFHGIHFCYAPHLFFICGGTVVSAWLSGCVACILLALERCSEVNPHFFLRFLFGKRTFRIVMVAFFIYNLMAFLFVKPLIYNPDYFSIIYDPMIGKDPSLYDNLWVAYNNIIVSIATTSLNFYLCYYLIFNFGYSTSMWLYKSKRQIVMQGVILCFFHATAAILYDIMQFINPPIWFILISETVWQISCGCLPIAYLTLNRSIRNTVLKMIIPKRVRVYMGLHIGIEEHLALEQMNAGGATSSPVVNAMNGAMVNTVGVVVKMDNYLQHW